MSDRRNHYRILHVQPDAPFEVIRANYRALMKKLRLHPDLGGDHWNAVYLNSAYAALKDSKKRAAYDQELLEKYDIGRLSRGPLKKLGASDATTREGGANQRNYYRILQVQVDAPQEIIEASYGAIFAKGQVSEDLLAEAFATLSDPDLRAAYDRVLEGGGHRKASAQPKVDQEPEPKHSEPEPPGAYRPMIKHYCAFCKTPYSSNQSPFAQSGCLECKSPLFPPSQEFMDQARRAVTRTEKNETLGFYTYWPGRLLPAHLLDLSPTGLLLKTSEMIEAGDVIKIEARRFGAVGEIVHLNQAGSIRTAGVQFQSVGFEKWQGTFFSTRA